MQILIVHRDAEIGAQLVQMVKAYTAHECELVRADAEAFAWAETHPRCDFLLTQLEADGIDGFALSGGLSERFPRLQTAFFPAYRASEQRLEIRDTKFFRSRLMASVCWKCCSARKRRRRGEGMYFIRWIFCRCVV